MGWPINTRFLNFVSTVTGISAASLNAIQDALLGIYGGTQTALTQTFSSTSGAHVLSVAETGDLLPLRDVLDMPVNEWKLIDRFPSPASEALTGTYCRIYVRRDNGGGLAITHNAHWSHAAGLWYPDTTGAVASLELRSAAGWALYTMLSGNASWNDIGYIGGNPWVVQATTGTFSLAGMTFGSTGLLGKRLALTGYTALSDTDFSLSGLAGTAVVGGSFVGGDAAGKVRFTAGAAWSDTDHIIIANKDGAFPAGSVAVVGYCEPYNVGATTYPQLVAVVEGVTPFRLFVYPKSAFTNGQSYGISWIRVGV